MTTLDDGAALIGGWVGAVRDCPLLQAPSLEGQTVSVRYAWRRELAFAIGARREAELELVDTRYGHGLHLQCRDPERDLVKRTLAPFAERIGEAAERPFKIAAVDRYAGAFSTKTAPIATLTLTLLLVPGKPHDAESASRALLLFADVLDTLAYPADVFPDLDDRGAPTLLRKPAMAQWVVGVVRGCTPMFAGVPERFGDDVVMALEWPGRPDLAPGKLMVSVPTIEDYESRIVLDTEHAGALKKTVGAADLRPALEKMLQKALQKAAG